MKLAAQPRRGQSKEKQSNRIPARAKFGGTVPSHHDTQKRQNKSNKTQHHGVQHWPRGSKARGNVAAQHSVNCAISVASNNGPEVAGWPGCGNTPAFSSKKSVTRESATFTTAPATTAPMLRRTWEAGFGSAMVRSAPFGRPIPLPQARRFSQSRQHFRGTQPTPSETMWAAVFYYALILLRWLPWPSRTRRPSSSPLH